MRNWWYAGWVTVACRVGGRARGSGRACLVDEQCLVRLLLARMVEQQQAHGVACQVDQHQAELRATTARGEAGPGRAGASGEAVRCSGGGRFAKA